jgi:hypothetical protein
MQEMQLSQPQPLQQDPAAKTRVRQLWEYRQKPPKSEQVAFKIKAAYVFSPPHTAAVEMLTRLHTSPSTGETTSWKTPDDDGLNSPLMKFTAVLVDMSRKARFDIL